MIDHATEEAAVEAIHAGTAIYTAEAEIEALLDRIDWPSRGGRLIDPATGDGNMLVAAVRRMGMPRDDVEALCGRIHGVEFHAQSAMTARHRISDELRRKGWSETASRTAADQIVECRDFLLTDDDRRYDVVLANPPYWRRANLMRHYAARIDTRFPPRARGDLLHAYLERCMEILSPDGRLALITSDRWLLNSGAARLREHLGRTLRVEEVRRLDAASAFHRPKERRKGTAPRVHPVSVILSGRGDTLGSDPHPIDRAVHVEGVPLRDLVEIRLAPWVGPDGIFLVGAHSGLPTANLVPCVEPRDICPRTDAIGPTRRWAIVTGDETPPTPVMEHLDATLANMPPRGRRNVRWLPPERFAGRLPLDQDAILVPRLAQRLRAVHLPAGTLPTNHSLVVLSGMPVDQVRRMLTDPRVSAQAEALALRVDDGYRSYTASLLRQLVVPYDLIEEWRRAA